MSDKNPVLSRHRLPRFYRWSLSLLWLTPAVLLASAHTLTTGLDWRMLPLLLVMALPAVYTWQEGVDVLREGIVTRLFIPRYHPYHKLYTWRADHQVIVIWDWNNHKIFEAHAKHLTDAPLLLYALQIHLHPA